VLTEPRFWRAGAGGLSATFQGRDLFAPVAAHLASGVGLEALGDRLDPAELVRLPILESVVGPGGVEGALQAIDGYGNLILSIENRVADRAGRLRIGDRLVSWGASYGAVAIGELVCVPGSLGWLEVACNGGSAAVLLGARVGDRVWWEA
jgi:S-adenosyl-L-methionine hydrolase (adenosine-forming)